MINRFDFKFVIKQILNIQSYERQGIDKIRLTCGKNNPADAMFKASLNLVLERIMSTNKKTIRLEV